jgi:hypothetical protein
MSPTVPPISVMTMSFPSAIRRIWREEGLMKTKRRKHRTKQNLRAVKAQWALGQQFCVDTKDLDDIPELWPQIQRHDLPLIQYTAREVVSGLQYLAYARERSLCYATLFMERILAHVQACGLSLDGCFALCNIHYHLFSYPGKQC